MFFAWQNAGSYRIQDNILSVSFQHNPVAERKNTTTAGNSENSGSNEVHSSVFMYNAEEYNIASPAWWSLPFDVFERMFKNLRR